MTTIITTREGHQSVLTCSVAGDPLPLLEWEKIQDTAIDLSNIHSVYSNGTLVIDSTDRSDAGDYICRGVNVGGEDQDTISLNVSVLGYLQLLFAFECNCKSETCFSS